MAQYSKRGKGWQARIQWRDSFGKRHTKSKAGFATKTLAKKWAVDNESQLNKGVSIDKSISLYDYFVHWVDTYKRPKLSQISIDRYDSLGKLIHAYFGNTAINQISRSNYQNFINQYGKKHAPSSVQKTNGFIRACVNSAILDDYLIKDFTQSVTLTADDSRVVKVEYLSLDEIQRLIKAIINGRHYGYTSRYMILTAIYTGMRKEEIQALTWKDIDFKNGSINISKAYDEKLHQFKPTKTSESVRKIAVNAELLKYLKELQVHSKSTMIFMDQFGTIPTSTALNRTLRKLLQDINVHKEGFHFHSLRHSHVALLLSQGIDIYAISKRLGHSNITTTTNTYAYLLDEYKYRMDKKIVQALSTIKC